jgi:hypothetical protein
VAPQPGSLVFNFTRTQSALDVPGTTERLRFQDVDSDYGVEVDYSSTVLLADVPSYVTRLLITALDSNNEPLASTLVLVDVVAGQTTTVDFGDQEATPITKDIRLTPDVANIGVGDLVQFRVSASFSNGEFASVEGAVFSTLGDVGTITPDGLFTATAEGTGSVVVTLEGGGTESATVNVRPPGTGTGGGGDGGSTGTPGGIGDGGTTTTPPPEPNGNTGNFTMQGTQRTLPDSDSVVNDYIAGGRTWLYTNNNATFTGRAHGDKNGVTISIDGFNGDGEDDEESWSVSFAAPEGQELTTGTYNGATRYPFNDPPDPGLSISGDGRGCNTLSGEFTISSIQFGTDDDGNNILLGLSANYTQDCEMQEGNRHTGTITFSSTP